MAYYSALRAHLHPLWLSIIYIHYSHLHTSKMRLYLCVRAHQNQNKTVLCRPSTCSQLVFVPPFIYMTIKLHITEKTFIQREKNDHQQAYG